MIRYCTLIFLLLLGLLLSCTEERWGDFTLLTEEVVNVSGERAIILGRILATQNVRIEDHGFHFSTDNNFSDQIVLSLGPTENPGRFVGEQDGFDLGIRYFVRAFAVFSGETLLGNTIEFSTILASIDSFEPMTQSPGDIITIIGRNFGDDAEVFFGESKGTVIENSNGFRIRVRVPSVGSEIEVPLKILTRGIEIFADHPFKYVTGQYTRLEDIPNGEAIKSGIFFQQGSNFHVGLGYGVFSNPKSEIFAYSPVSQDWSQTPFEGRTHWKPFSSRSGYFGGGYLINNAIPQQYNPDFWYFDGEKYHPLPSPPLQFANSICFEIQNEIYVAGGDLAVGSVVRKFDPVSNTWSFSPNLPFNVNQDMLHFTYNDKLYLIDNDKLLWEYDPFTSVSRVAGKYPSPFIDNISDTGGIAIVLGNKAYLGLYVTTPFMWELDMETFNWSKKTDFPGDLWTSNAGIFVHEEAIYIFRSARFDNFSEFWRFDPEKF
ncbi:IPT/TIG domain-containing protein [Aquiflexum sp.]|uniref:IPT/TIG domain-containing protein n=1 Tax=Aquiflexum sp. TaxID=1872584 RepID=UPI00359427EF